jgi:excinuclease ABC subunit A
MVKNLSTTKTSATKYLKSLGLSNYFVQFLVATDLNNEIESLLSKALSVDTTLRSKITAQIQKIIKNTPLPQEYKTDLLKEASFSPTTISIKGAKENNLKDVTIDIPLRCFVAITGVSGSGKSTLINDIFANYLMNYFYDSRLTTGAHDEITGLENIDKAIIIDQSPIGRTPRSNPATYTKLFDPIRQLFADLPESRARGYSQGRFSFNVPGGRCETCEGDGLIKVVMQFLPNVYVICEDCRGKRYNRETLEIEYNGKNIAQILEMPVSEALSFFTTHDTIKRRLNTLHRVGLDYIKLGQPATTLSGGEAQRVKLATELSKIGTGNTLYILDEPTTGLHPLDVKMLLKVLHELVDKGNTVLVIEHNLDVIKTADWIIDLGPEGGDKGGEIVAIGLPDDIIKVEKSYTGKYLKHTLKNS